MSPEILKHFRTPRYSGAWLSFHSDRGPLRKAIEALLRDVGFAGRLEVREDGPHWIDGDGLHLSYSHTIRRTSNREGLALVVWSALEPIGVDLESMNREFHEDPLRIAERFFHPIETAALRKSSADPETLRREFLGLWLRKEALGKLTRKGLRSSISLETRAVESVVFELPPVTPAGFLACVALRSAPQAP